MIEPPGVDARLDDQPGELLGPLGVALLRAVVAARAGAGSRRRRGRRWRPGARTRRRARRSGRSTSGQPRARDDAVLDVVVGRDPAHRRERRLARPPDQLALGLVLRRPGRRSAPACPRRRSTTSSKRASHSASAPSSSTTSAAPGVRGIAGVRGPLGRLDRQPVHHLDRSRDDPGRDDRPTPPPPRAPAESKKATSVRTVSGVGITRSQIFVATPERPLGADEGAQEVVAGPVELLAADLHELAVGQHELEPGDVVGGEAVLEAVRAAGVLGHVAADRADDLARRVGRVEVIRADRASRRRGWSPPARRPPAGSARSTSITRRIRESAISTPSFDRQRAAGEPGARAACHPGHARVVAGARRPRRTSSAEPGSTAAAGVCAYWSRPSDS